MKWIKRSNTKKTFLEREMKLFAGKNFQKENSANYKVYDLEKAAERILAAKENGELIYTVGDYDVDGVFSLAELDSLYKAIGISNYILRCPRRISEGYGLSFNIVKEIIKYDPGLCILVDNGIAAYDQVAELCAYGWDVLIMDHHQLPADGKLPPADIIIDPEAIPGQADFPHYCGAGLVYKLASEMLNEAETLNQILSYAAIATCADCVPFIQKDTHACDNWLIVREGLKSIVRPTGRTKTLYVLLRTLGIDTYATEDDFGYRIGPIVNASGRLYDNGAQEVLDYFTDTKASFHDMEARVQELIATNNKRKDIQKKILEKVRETIVTPSNGIMVIYEPDIPEGIVGLVAGDLTNTYKIPAIVFTNAANGELKGSARSTDDVNIINLIFGQKDLLVRCGGHKKAAGLGVKSENYEKFKAAIEAAAGKYNPVNDISYYDYEISPEEAPEIWEQLEKFAPYGEGHPYPVFKIKGYEVASSRLIGATGNTIKLTSKGNMKLDAINFNGSGKDQYSTLGLPEKIDLYGQLAVNMWNGKKILQVRFDELMESQ